MNERRIRRPSFLKGNGRQIILRVKKIKRCAIPFLSFLCVLGNRKRKRPTLVIKGLCDFSHKKRGPVSGASLSAPKIIRLNPSTWTITQHEKYADVVSLSILFSRQKTPPKNEMIIYHYIRSIVFDIKPEAGFYVWSKTISFRGVKSNFHFFFLIFSSNQKTFGIRYPPLSSL